MTTKYNTGDVVMVPATIRGAMNEGDKVVYEVETDWRVPEEYVEESRTTVLYEAFKTLNKKLQGDLMRY